MPLMTEKSLKEFLYNIENDIVVNKNIPLRSPDSFNAMYVGLKLDLGVEGSWFEGLEPPRYI